jgi:hypothetical protein
MKFLPIILQVAGFVGAVAAWTLRQPPWYLAFFIIHFIGDILFVLAGGLPTMSFLDNLDRYVKLKQFIQFVGLMGLGGTLFLSHASFPVKLLGFVAFGLSMAGFVYDLIYQ